MGCPVWRLPPRPDTRRPGCREIPCAARVPTHLATSGERNDNNRTHPPRTAMASFDLSLHTRATLYVDGEPSDFVTEHDGDVTCIDDDDRGRTPSAGSRPPGARRPGGRPRRAAVRRVRQPQPRAARPAHPAVRAAAVRLPRAAWPPVRGDRRRPAGARLRRARPAVAGAQGRAAGRPQAGGPARRRVRAGGVATSPRCGTTPTRVGCRPAGSPSTEPGRASGRRPRAAAVLPADGVRAARPDPVLRPATGLDDADRGELLKPRPGGGAG